MRFLFGTLDVTERRSQPSFFFSGSLTSKKLHHRTFSIFRDVTPILVLFEYDHICLTIEGILPVEASGFTAQGEFAHPNPSITETALECCYAL